MQVLDAGSSSNDLERAKLAGETARHYGTMRFAMFTVFTAILGALIAFAASENGTRFMTGTGQKYLACSTSLLLSILFGLTEWRISYLVATYQEDAYSATSLRRPKGHKLWRNVVLLTMLSPYVFSAVFWTLLALGAIRFD